jgi:hypothetical protein
MISPFESQADANEARAMDDAGAVSVLKQFARRFEHSKNQMFRENHAFTMKNLHLQVRKCADDRGQSVGPLR